MKKVKFSIQINAPRERIWNILWGKESYNRWTSVFTEDSHVVTDWTEGSKALFLDGKGEGMFSRIESNKPNEFMAIRHLGIVKAGKEQPENEQSKLWSGAMENYTLTRELDQTRLSIEMDTTDEFFGYFNDTWPKALHEIKSLAEKPETI